MIGFVEYGPGQRGPSDRQRAPEGQDASRLLREARLLPATQAATVLRPLIAMMEVRSGHSVEIEALQANAWLAICTLVESLEKLCVPKIRFCNIDGEGHQGQVVR